MANNMTEILIYPTPTDSHYAGLYAMQLSCFISQ